MLEKEIEDKNIAIEKLKSSLCSVEAAMLITHNQVVCESKASKIVNEEHVKKYLHHERLCQEEQRENFKLKA